MGIRTILHPANWYESRALINIKSMVVYISNSELQIIQSIDHFCAHKTTEYIDDDHKYGMPVDMHLGLDSVHFDLDHTFLEIFPNIHRKSTFITLYTFLETELMSLCQLFQREYNYKITVADMNGLGIDRSTLYLSKVCNLALCRSNNRWQKIKAIQKIRNTIVHDEGKLTDHNGAVKTEELKFANEQKINKNNEIYLTKDFLTSVIVTFDDFFKQLNSEINPKHSY